MSKKLWVFEVEVDLVELLRAQARHYPGPLFYAEEAANEIERLRAALHASAVPDLLAALREITDTCQATMDHSNKVMVRSYGGRRTKEAQAVYDRMRASTDRARAAIANSEGALA